ncbi:iron ABC transporter permease [bacterium]|nr:iron ABC transporter permease [bacterium]
MKQYTNIPRLLFYLCFLALILLCLFWGLSAGEGYILLAVRLPNLLVALISGASLGLAGALSQMIFRNPLADPYILGVSAGSSAGISIAFLTGAYSLLGYFSIFILSFSGGIFALLVIFSVYSASRRKDTVILLLSGVIFGYIAVSLTSLILSNLEGNIIFSLTEWLFGTTAFFDMTIICIFALLLLVVIIISLMRHRSLDRMYLSDKKMLSLGEDPIANRKFFFFLIALLVSFSVSVTGIIGFLGLIAPHIARRLKGSNAKSMIPLSAITGAFLLTAAHLFSLIVKGIRVPVGISISLMGGIYFIILLRRGYASEI